MSEFNDAKIVVQGNVLTDESIIKYHVQSALSSKSSHTLSERLNHAWKSLHSLGMFEQVGISVQSDNDTGDSNPGRDLNIIVTINESKSYLAKVQLSTGSAGPEVELEGLLRGRLGFAESLRFSVSRSERRRDFLVALARASPFAMPIRTEISVRQGATNNQAWASFVDHQRSISASISNIENSNQLSYDICWRDPVPSLNPHNSLASNASWTVINQCRPSLKTSLKYNYFFKYQALSNCVASLEVAMPPGQVKGISASLSSKYTVNFLSNLSWSIYGSGGVMKLLNSTRFVSDWPIMRLKGYDTNGFCQQTPTSEGGRPGGDRVPGEVFGQVTSTIGSKFGADSSFSWLLFLSTGCVTDWEMSNKLVRLSTGAGLGIETEGGRLEITLAMPIKPLESDKLRYFDINLT